MTIEQNLMLIVSFVVILSLLLNIIQAVYINGAVPLDKVGELIDRLRPYAERTPTPVDNILLDTADNLIEEIEDDTVTDTAG